MPRTACRVVCGLSLVMTILLPTRALVRVDLPAFGRPTKHAKPDRYCTRRSSQIGKRDCTHRLAVSVVAMRAALLRAAIAVPLVFLLRVHVQR